MRQALHIFRKDVRFLWPAIGAVLALTALFAWGQSVVRALFLRGNSSAEAILGVVCIFLVLSWWYLIASAIHKEQPNGDRACSVTRPYSWKSLVTAKAMLFFVFIAIPFFVSDAAILMAHGVSVAESASSLLQRQFVLAAIVLFPLAALSAVARYMLQILMTAVVLFLAYVFWGHRLPYQVWGHLSWIRDLLLTAIVLSASLGAFAFQYARRRSLVSGGILAAAGGLCFIILTLRPSTAAVAIQSHFPAPAEDLSAIQLSLVHDPYLDRNIAISSGAALRIKSPAPHAFAIRLDGMPQGMEFLRIWFE